MEKDYILQYIKSEFCNVVSVTEAQILYLEQIIDEYHCEHTIDEELLIYEAMDLLIVPVADYPKSIYLLELLNTPKSILLQAIIKQQNEGFIPESLIEKLNNIFGETNNLMYQSAIKTIIADNVDDTNTKTELLNQAIKLYPKTVSAYLKLGNLHFNSDMIKKGLSNVSKIMTKDSVVNFIDFDSFIKEKIIGNEVTDIYYNELCRKLEK